MQTITFNMELHTKLSDFGLNPDDWILVYEFGSRYRIEYRTDANYFFSGIAQTKGIASWEYIELAGI